MADEFPRDGVRHPGGFELARGGVPQRMETDFIQLPRRAAAFAGAVMAALLRQAGSHEDFVKLVAQVSGAALALHNSKGARE